MITESRYVDVQIKKPDGSIVFEKKQFRVPADWSDRAATIMASKYATDEEYSAYTIIDRVVNQIAKWGTEQGYFTKTVFSFNGIDQDIEPDFDASLAFEKNLKDILINQRAAFNSPVWFNCGTKNNSNQMSACFIVPVEDTMESILNHNEVEGMIFRGGSGAGCNVSKLRGKGEKLSNKGTASGPLSFMKMWDTTAGVIKSGGKTRRSAKMICMDVDHPDILDFIQCKKKEEDKAKYLIAAGLSPEDAYETVAFQNTNHSIVVTDAFMNAYLTQKEGEANWHLKNRGDGETRLQSPREILSDTAQIAWATGDPGIIFSDRVNKDNPIPSIGKINSPNPCSEFFAVDNSSCNLASLNLVKYFREDREEDFDWKLFKEDINIMIMAMDILIDAASYPTPEIRSITIDTRPLGLGFSNLGALLILMGYPYDSEDARMTATLITKSMTQYAYKQSIRLAKKMGSFRMFRHNKEKNLEIAMRLTETDEMNEIFQDMSEHGLRNSQVTLLAPTGTISFMMDCDTTGIEPLFALKSYKQLAGGGGFEIEAPCVDTACNIIRKKTGVRAFNTQIIEGKEWKDIFKTANEISWKGHIDMMAACQRHLNGAISKTVNMPSNCDYRDIVEAYIYAWERELKCLAIYRDGSKGMQPLTEVKDKEQFKIEIDPIIPDETKWTAVRRNLPSTVPSIRHKFNIAGFEGYIHCGTYEDGSLGELFIIAEKMGSTMQGFLDAFATSISLGLQYGVPLEKLIAKFTGTRFDPAGLTTNPDIQLATSVIDYLFRWLEQQFIDKEDEDLYEDHGEMNSYVPPPKKISFDGPPCPHCNSITGKVGTCYLCSNCGSTTGCS